MTRFQHWYRIAGNRTYKFHAAEKDWVHTGKAVCGEDISNPALTRTMSVDAAVEHRDACRHCIRILQKGNAQSAPVEAAPAKPFCPECGGSAKVRLISHRTGWPIGPGGVCDNAFHAEAEQEQAEREARIVEEDISATGVPASIRLRKEKDDD